MRRGCYSFFCSVFKGSPSPAIPPMLPSAPPFTCTGTTPSTCQKNAPQQPRPPWVLPVHTNALAPRATQTISLRRAQMACTHRRSSAFGVFVDCRGRAPASMPASCGKPTIKWGPAPWPATTRRRVGRRASVTTMAGHGHGRTAKKPVAMQPESITMTTLALVACVTRIIAVS